MREIEKLKILLMSEGLTITQKALHALSGFPKPRPLTLADYATTSGITLMLDEDIWVNAPINLYNPNFVNSTSFFLDLNDGAYVITNSEKVFHTYPVPVPSFHDQHNSLGQKYTQFAITHADRVRISPISGCSYTCKFCDLPYKGRYRLNQVENLIESIEVAFQDSDLPARHVLISGGSPRQSDVPYLQGVYETVQKRFPQTSVDIMMVPNPEILNLRTLHEIGVFELSLNLEIYDEEIAKKIMPVKAKFSRSDTLRFLEQAVNIFGPGRVRSILIVGLEPLESTLDGVTALSQRGVTPVLSPFRPDPSTPMKKKSPPGPDFLETTYMSSREIVEKYDQILGPRCIPCQHNTLTFPDKSGQYFYS